MPDAASLQEVLHAFARATTRCPGTPRWATPPAIACNRRR